MPGEKTEKATPKRKRDERKKGNVFLSRDVVLALSLFTSFYAMKFLFPLMLSTITESMHDFFSLIPVQHQVTDGDVRIFFIKGVLVFAKTALPLLLITAAAAIFSTMLQTRMHFSAKAFSFKGERINPLSGFKKMFSIRGMVELLKSLLKIAILTYVVYTGMKEEILLFPRLSGLSFLQAMSYTGEIILGIVLKAGIIFIFLAGADYLYQWWEYEKNLRMSKQEIKDEYKQMEGDPQVKGRQRSIGQQRARRRMLQSVPGADVVIRNPTHFAVALKYDQSKNNAPIVIAKGADQLAFRIIKIAEENGVYVTEDKALARALFEAVEVDSEIPEKFFKPVAQVLAFVYTLKKKDLN